jgi:N-acetyl-gamma-glutamyl-phosphate reductase
MTDTPSARYRVAVVGASGYAGGELVRLLSQHPAVEVTFLGAGSSAGRTLGEVHPNLASSPLASMQLRPVDDPAAVSAAAELAFCCLPHGASSSLAPSLLDDGAKVIDLAGDFRLEAGDYPEWYGFEHPAQGWLSKAVYGLPELLGEQIAGAQLVANPGCFPTPVVLGLAPLFGAGLIGEGPIRVDGKTGVSGAGRATSESTSFSASDGSIRPYRAPLHQHTPEMERALELAAGVSSAVVFVPHLVPTVRGVVATCYAPASAGASTETVVRCLQQAYSGEPFVRVLELGEMVDVKRTIATNTVELQAFVDPRTTTLVVIGALDNLIKGAAGQAIQNMNLMLGLEVSTALPKVAAYP